ncbi:MAG: DUF3857 domain-containing protein [Fuerstiella sp.]
MFRIAVSFVVLLLSCGMFTESSAQELSGSGLSVDELNQIIRDSKDTDWVAPELSGYLRLNASATTLSRSKQGVSSGAFVKISTRVFRNQYLVIEHSVMGAKATYFDVVAFDSTERLYHRWRLQDNQVVWQFVGVGNMDASVRSALPANDKLSISWTQIANADRPQTEAILAIEEVAREADGSLKGTWHWQMFHLAGGKVVQNESSRVAGKLGDYSGEQRRLMAKAAQQNQVDSGKKTWWERLKDQPKDSLEDIPRLDLAKAGREYRFEADGFLLRSPGPGFVSTDPEFLSPTIRLSLRRKYPFQQVLVLTEKMPLAGNARTSDLLPILKGKVKVANPSGTLHDLEPTTIGKLKFETFTSESAGGLPRVEVISVALSGKQLYRVITLGAGQNRMQSWQFHRSVLNGFELIEVSQEAAKQELVYERPDAGLTIDWGQLSAIGVRRLDDLPLRIEMPAADVGVSFDGGMCAVLTSGVSGHVVSDDVLKSATVALLGGSFPSDVRRSKKITMGSASGEELELGIRTLNGETNLTLVRILRNADDLIALVAWTAEPEANSVELLRSTLDAATFRTPETTATKVAKKHHFMWPNQIGLSLYERGLPEQAHPFFQSADRINPGDPILQSNVAVSLLHSGRFSDAFNQSADYLKIYGTNRELKLIQAEALVGLARETEAIAAYKEIHDVTPLIEEDLIKYVDLMMSVGQTSEAAKVAENYASSLGSPRIAIRQWLIDTLASAERYDDAIARSRELIRDFPSEPQYTINLAQILIDSEQGIEALQEIEGLRKQGHSTAGMLFVEGQCFLEMKQYAKAKSAFEAALIKIPGNPTLEDAVRLASTLLGQGDNSAIKTVIAPVDLPEFVSKQIRPTVNKNDVEGFGYRPLVSWTGFQYRKGQKLKQTDYREVLIRTQAAVEQYKLIEADFNPATERLYVNFVEVLDTNGKVISEGRIDDYYLTTADQAMMATADQYLNIPVPGLKPGRTLRYQYTREDLTTTDLFPFKRRGFVQSVPGGPRAVFVVGDCQQLLTGTAPDSINATQDEESECLSFVCAEPPLLHLESRMPRLDNFFPTIWLGEKGESWQQIGASYLARIQPQLKPSAAAAEQARRIVADFVKNDSAADRSALNQSDKAAAIVRWIQEEFTYQSLEFGVRGLVPNDPKRILSNRYGDCKDLSLLAWQMLNSQGIPCHLGLIDSSVPVIRQVPSMEQFNHMIIFLPNIDGGTFVDCTQGEMTPFRTATSYMAESDVLVLDPKLIRFRKIPTDPGNASSFECDRVVSLADNQRDLEVTETITIDGLAATSFRAFFKTTNPADLKNNLQGALTDQQRLRIQTLSAEHVTEPQEPLVIHMSYRIDKAVRKNGMQVLVTIPVVWESYNFKESAGYDRKNAFELDSAATLKSHITLKLPTGFQLATIPEDDVIQSTWVDAERVVTSKPNTLSFTNSLVQKNGIYPASEYESFQDNTNAGLSLFAAEVVFKPVDLAK